MEKSKGAAVARRGSVERSSPVTVPDGNADGDDVSVNTNANANNASASLNNGNNTGAGGASAGANADGGPQSAAAGIHASEKFLRPPKDPYQKIAPLDMEAYDFDMRRFGIGKPIKNLEPLPFTMSAGGRGGEGPEESEGGGEPSAAAERPITSSFSYLQACDQSNIAPWNLVTKCEDPSSPKLNLKGLTIGGSFSKCLR